MRERVDTLTSAPTLRTAPLQVETIDQRYALGRLLGKGASANVHAAHDLRLERDVVVKILHPHVHACATDRARFWHEARILASFSHPNIVTVHDFVESRGRLCLVMEVVSGGTLHDLLKVGTLSPERALSLLLPIMGALAYAHDRRVVHRDIKPSNIALTTDACGRPTAKLLDFGVARFDSRRITQPGILLGTPEYMAPEQVLSKDIGPYTDVWAMGVVLFTCLAGRQPFRRGPTVDLLNEIATRRPPSLRELCPALPARLAEAVDKALSPGLTMRHADMREFARALAAACAEHRIGVRDPDPVGLPEFASWQSPLDGRSTQSTHSSALAVPQAEPAATKPALKAQSKVQTAIPGVLPPVRRGKAPLALCALLAGFFGGNACWDYANTLREPAHASLRELERESASEHAVFGWGEPSYSSIPRSAPREVSERPVEPRARLPRVKPSEVPSPAALDTAAPAPVGEQPVPRSHIDLFDRWED